MSYYFNLRKKGHKILKSAPLFEITNLMDHVFTCALDDWRPEPSWMFGKVMKLAKRKKMFMDFRRELTFQRHQDFLNRYVKGNRRSLTPHYFRERYYYHPYACLYPKKESWDRWIEDTLTCEEIREEPDWRSQNGSEDEQFDPFNYPDSDHPSWYASDADNVDEFS